jgi:hypothetical protein
MLSRGQVRPPNFSALIAQFLCRVGMRVSALNLEFPISGLEVFAYMLRPQF